MRFKGKSGENLASAPPAAAAAAKMAGLTLPNNLREIVLIIPLRKNPCGFLYYKCKYCQFWVHTRFAVKLYNHTKRFHVETSRGQKTTLTAVPSLPEIAAQHVKFPQFIGTDFGDTKVFASFRDSLYYLTTSSHVTLPYVKIFHTILSRDFFLCPFCHAVFDEEQPLRVHLYTHVRLQFE